MWAFFALYFKLLAPAGALEVIVHRATWGLVTCLAVLAITRHLASLLAIIRDRAVLSRLMAAGLLITINWTVYVYAVLTDRVVDAALGYFINPVVTVALAVFVLKERFNRRQKIALGLGLLAVAYLVVTMGELPWISLVLAFSFGFYGLVKKQVATRVPPVAGMAVETATVVPGLLAYLGYLVWNHESSFQKVAETSISPVLHLFALIGAGVLTVLPLLLFAKASQTLPLGILGLMQYISPIGQMLIGVLILGETMSIHRWIATIIVWIALVFLSIDGVRAAVKIGRMRAMARKADKGVV